MVEQTTVWVDRKGKFHRTETEAVNAEDMYDKEDEIHAIKTILQTASRELGRKPGGLPNTIDEAAIIAIHAYPALKRYYGD